MNAELRVKSDGLADAELKPRYPVLRSILFTHRSVLLTIFVLLFTLHSSLFTVSAQKYPERRETRAGTKAYNKGDFTAAETFYRRALEMNPEFNEARFNLGDAALRQEEKGEEAAQIFIDIASDSLAAPGMVSAASFNAGNVMLAGQKIQEAIEFYKQSLRINPGDMQAKYNLAYARKMMQDNQNQNQDQNDQDQNQDQDQDQNDQNQDRQDENQDENGNNKDNNGENEPPKPQPGDRQEATIDPQDAEQMLEAMQDAEDKTREEMNAREVPAVGRSGKNW